MTPPLLEFIIPTFNNPSMLQSCVNSIALTMHSPVQELIHITIVNNGHPGSLPYKSDKVTVLEPGENLGWEGGLIYGLAHTQAPFVAFCNDDIRMVTGTMDWFWKMMSLFNDPSVGAVGPSSNYVMGSQQIFVDVPDTMLNVKFLIGFFMILRRSALEKAGGVDDTLPGGDDIDLSIRLKDAGYNLICRRDVFVYHHGSATGARIHGGYWNSPQMQEATNLALIRKHGMRKYWDTFVMGSRLVSSWDGHGYASTDVEGDICKAHVIGDKILEVGCGARKTHPKSVGVDRNNKQEKTPFIPDPCVADLVDDVSIHLPCEYGSQDTIIARHIIEHCQDTLGTLKVWNGGLRFGGRLIIATPNSRLGNTIVMNPEHVTTFTPKSLESQAAVCGFKQIECREDVNGVSFISVFQKIAEPSTLIAAPEPTIHPLGARIGSEETVNA